MSTDMRVTELEALAREEGFELPYSAAYIIWLEDRGRIVELPSGEMYNGVTVQPPGQAKAVAYLLANVEGEQML